MGGAEPRPSRVTIIAATTAVAFVSTVIVLVALWPTRARVDRLIDERLAERGLAPLPVTAGSESASASPAPSARPDAGSKSDPVGESSAFLARLDDLMHDYKPELPVVEDKSDVLRCVTSDVAKNDPNIKKVVAALKMHIVAAKQEKARREGDFYGAMYPLAFHYDLDWRTRKLTDRLPEYGCWVDAAPIYSGASAVLPGHWSTNLLDQSQCQPYADAWGEKHMVTWKVANPGHAGAFVYSNSDTPPNEPPELMRRAGLAGVKPLARFSCRVEDVLPDQEHRIIKCRSTGPATTIRVSGDLSAANVGDVVSVPLAGTKRDPDGVLFKNVTGKTGGWVVDADAATLTVDSAATCPSTEEIQAAIGTTGGK